MSVAQYNVNYTENIKPRVKIKMEADTFGNARLLEVESETLMTSLSAVRSVFPISGVPHFRS